MPTSREITVELTEDEVAFVERVVARGEFASAADVIRNALNDRIARDEAFEEWLQREVVPTLEAFEKDPSRGIPAEDVFAELRTRIAKETKAAE